MEAVGKLELILEVSKNCTTNIEGPMTEMFIISSYTGCFSNSLYHIACGIMQYLQWNGHPTIDFFE